VTTVAGGLGSGSGNNQLNKPFSVFVDEYGNIFIADLGNNRIQKWAAGASSGVTVAGGNGAGSAANQLNGGAAVFVDQAGNIFVSDGGNNRVQKWGPGATNGITVAGGNGPGGNANQLFLPSGIYVDCDGNLYIADQRNYRIQLWAPGATGGITVAGGNGAGSAENQFLTPSAVWLDGQKNIYVTDAAAGCVQKWAPGASSGVRVAGTNSVGANANQLEEPTGLYVDYNGDIYVSDQIDVERWMAGAGSGTAIAAGNGLNQFGASYDVYLDNKGNIFNCAGYPRIQKMELNVTIDTSYTPNSAGIYFALVTDVNGFPMKTDSVTINNSPVTPSLKISATATSVFICTPITFTATAVNAGAYPSYQWEVSGVRVGADSTTYSNNIFADGDQVICIMSSNTGCTIVNDTSNIISLKIDPQGHASVNITSSGNEICAGSAVTFTATVTNGSNAPIFEWLLNGNDTGDSSSAYSSSNLSNGDVIYCLITSDASCGLAKSNSIPISVDAIPTIPAGQIFNIPYGQSMTLDPIITGDIASYLWSPSTGLSDSTIRNPIARPVSDMEYTLAVVTPNGCKGTGQITVNAYTPLRIPNAFTPNGDGRNDIFYVLGGPDGSRISDFSIFNRWGQIVFQVHDAVPGDPAFGWNGYFHGTPAPVGTYVYLVNMGYSNGLKQSYKGTLVLLR
jgi:gliding motility-associated-like protein